MNNILNLSNFMSVSRIFCCIPLIYFLLKMHSPDSINYIYYRNLSILSIAYIIISDILDGYIARRLDSVTNIGKILDPLSDKICFMVILIYLINKNPIGDNFMMFYFKYSLNPFFIFFIVLSLRDIILISLYSYSIYSKNHVAQSNMSGKIFIVLSLLVFLLSIYDHSNNLIMIHHILFSLSMITMIYSMVIYIYEYYLLNLK